MMIPWNVYCKLIFKEELKKYGSYRKMAKALGISTKTIQNVIKMVVVPSVKSMKKWFPDLDIPEIMVNFLM